MSNQNNDKVKICSIFQILNERIDGKSCFIHIADIA